MPHNLVGVLRELKPHRALFTTYTFNPAFFEAAVLPAAFRPDGCQIGVLVDGGPLAASTLGAYAQHIGSRYAVAPVRAPGNGIFHPKIALLESHNRLVLCVGSGNLTASGLAHQLECLDVTDLSDDAGLSAQLKDFLSCLAGGCRDASPRAADMLASAATWIQTDSPPAPAQRRAARLLHTLERPVLEQIDELLRHEGHRTKTLTVLAPFHSKDGAAVRALREAVGASVLRVAHLGTVPCDAEAYAGAMYVSPVSPPVSRSLHAKVFEFSSDDGAWVVSGSVNATTQSLCLPKNVEVSIARWEASSPFGWETREPDSFEPQQQQFQPAAVWTMEAVLLGSSRLEALVAGKGASQAAVTWMLASAAGEIERGELTLDAEGLLIVDLPAPVAVLHMGLTLFVEGPSGEVARTWVNDQRALRAVRAGVRLRTNSSGDGHAASDYRLASDLIQKALGGTPIGGPSRSARGPQAARPEAAEPLDEAFNYADWVRSGRLRVPAGAGLNRRAGSFLNRVLDLLFPQRQQEDNPPPNGFRLNDANPDDEDGDERPDGAPPAKTPPHAPPPRSDTEREQLLKACQAVREAIWKGQPGIASVELLVLAVCALDVERAQEQFLAPSGGKPGGFDAHRVLVLWLDSLSRYGFEMQARGELLPVVCAMAATAAAVVPRVDPEERHLAQLRGAVCRLAGRPLAADEVLALIATGMREELMLRMHARFRAAGMKRAPDLANAGPIDELLLYALSSPPDPRMPSSLSPVAAARAGVRVLGAGIGFLTAEDVRERGCPICYLDFTDVERRETTYRRWLIHGSFAKHLLVFPDDIGRVRRAHEGAAA